MLKIFNFKKLEWAFLVTFLSLMSACNLDNSTNTQELNTTRESTISSTVNTAPISDAGGDKRVVVNTPINIVGSGVDSDGSITSYQWKKATTILANTAKFTYTPKDIGTDILTLTVVDNQGTSHSNSIRIVVEELSDEQAKRKVENLAGAPYGGVSIPKGLDIILKEKYATGSSSIVSTPLKVEIDCKLNQRAFVTWRNPKFLLSGHTYVLSFDVSDLEGSTSKGIQHSNSQYVPITQEGRVAFTFTKTKEGFVRIGSGLFTNATNTEVASYTISNLMVQDITNLTTTNRIDDYVERYTVSEYRAGNEIVNNQVSKGQGELISNNFRTYNKGVSTGDSFSNGPYDFPQQFSQLGDRVLINHGYSGETISGTLSANWQDFLDNPINKDADFFSIQGGTNDIIGEVDLSLMKKKWIEMAEAAEAQGLSDGMALNISPWAQHTIDPIKLKKVKDWNRWLKEECETRGYLYINIHDLLEDPTIPNRMNPLYVSGSYTGKYSYDGDVIHPNILGYKQIANLMIQTIEEEN
jgi:lysophospholipase L1-like esterase